MSAQTVLAATLVEPGRYELREYPLPEPAPGCVLVKMLMSGICGTDKHTFQGYTTHANRDLVSVGVSAIGHVGDLYVQNHKLLSAYEGALSSGVLPSSRGKSMSRDDHIRKQVINAIMCQGIVDIATIEADNAINFGEYFAAASERLLILQADGLVEMNSNYISLTSAGRLLMRTVAMAFDAYVNAAPGNVAPQSAAMSRVI